MPFTILPNPHTLSRQTFASVGIFLLTQAGLDSNFPIRIRRLEQS